MDKTIKQCPLCGEEIAVIAKKCKHCRSIIAKECPFCCELVAVDAKKCEHCREDLDRNTSNSARQVVPSPSIQVVPAVSGPIEKTADNESQPVTIAAMPPPISATAIREQPIAEMEKFGAHNASAFSLAAACDRLKHREHIGFAYDNQKIFKWLALTNAAIVLSVLVVTGLCGGSPLHDSSIWFWTGICVVVGLVAPFISLAMSKYLAKLTHDIRTISNKTAQSEDERNLVALVENLASRAGLPNTPEIGIYESEDMNAFATGMGKSNSLVAFSSALLHKLDGDSVSAVAAHEISHIANGDMITMSMVQSAVNALVLLFSMPIRLYRFFIHVTDDKNDWTLRLLVTALQFVIVTVLLFLGNLVVKAFSRHREFIADRQAASLTDPSSMIQALKLIGGQEISFPDSQKEYAAFKICSPSAMFDVFSTHPSIERRIEALSRMETDGNTAQPLPQ